MARGAPPTRSTQFRGEAGRARAEQELAKQKAAQEARKNSQHMPYRFRVAEGETKEVMVVDDAPDFFAFEHNMKNPKTGFWDIFTGCVSEFDNCPVCEASGRDAYYAMYLTVIDLTPYTNKANETVEFSRKLMVVKPAQQKKFTRFFEKNGSLRGAIFEMTRDGPKDSAIGNDIEFKEWMEEEDISTYVREWTDKEKKNHVENCGEVYDYEKLFPEPTLEALRAVVGGRPAPGSREQEREELGESSRPARGARRAAPAATDDWDDPDQGEAPWHGGNEAPAPAAEDSAPTRPSRRAAAEAPAPAARPSGRRAPAAAAPAPAARPSSRRTAAKAAVDDDDIPY